MSEQSNRVKPPSSSTRPDSSSPVSNADWRFLPGLPRGGKALVFCDGPQETLKGLSANFDIIAIASGSFHQAVRHIKNQEAAHDSRTTLAASPDPAPFSSKVFDLVAFPDGLSFNDNRKYHKSLDQLRAARRLIRSGGALYLGFANQRGYNRLLRSDSRQRAFYAPPGRMHQLITMAGFASSVAYGAIPNHRRPRFLVPLSSTALIYALRRHIRWKGKGVLEWWVGRREIARLLMGVLPAYGLVAKVAEE